MEGKLHKTRGVDSLATFRGDANLPPFEPVPLGSRKESAVASLISSAWETRDFSEPVNAPGNAEGSAREKLPCPSLRNTATG